MVVPCEIELSATAKSPYFVGNREPLVIFEWGIQDPQASSCLGVHVTKYLSQEPSKQWIQCFNPAESSHTSASQFCAPFNFNFYLSLWNMIFCSRKTWRSLMYTRNQIHDNNRFYHYMAMQPSVISIWLEMWLLQRALIAPKTSASSLIVILALQPRWVLVSVDTVETTR